MEAVTADSLDDVAARRSSALVDTRVPIADARRANERLSSGGAGFRAILSLD